MLFTQTNVLREHNTTMLAYLVQKDVTYAYNPSLDNAFESTKNLPVTKYTALLPRKK